MPKGADVTEPMKILSLGAGVQSSTLLYMSALGELPRIDHAIFADTGWEPKPVYEWLEHLKIFSSEHGIPLHVVSKGDLRKDAEKGSHTIDSGRHYSMMPIFTKNATTGHQGKIFARQCTTYYKVRIIQKKLRELAGLSPHQRGPGTLLVEHWFGISQDEIRRTRISPHTWIDYRYPLIEDCDPPMTRQDCISWWRNKGMAAPPRSSCCGCPFHRDSEWRWLKENDPAGWADAVEFDRKIRRAGDHETEGYLHRSVVPLDEVDLRSAEEKGQGNMFDNECTGVCGV